MVSDVIVARALKAFDVYEYTDREGAIRAALEAVEANFEQQFANEQVRLGREQGSCLTCGGPM